MGRRMGFLFAMFIVIILPACTVSMAYIDETAAYYVPAIEEECVDYMPVITAEDACTPVEHPCSPVTHDYEGEDEDYTAIIYETPEPESEQYHAPARLIAIDPGHQARGNYTLEPNGPGSSTYKARVATGTRGVATRVPEYQLVLEVSLMLRDELIARGHEVLMIRETHDVDISNRERAIMASEANADAFVRVHANGAASASAHGILTISHSPNNPYIPHLYEESRALSQHMLDGMIAATGARNLGVLEMDNMTGSNWSTVPVTIVEMGFMTNPEEDRRMNTEEYRKKLVLGMTNGIESFFAAMCD